jgi:hypothetical protein
VLKKGVFDPRCCSLSLIEMRSDRNKGRRDAGGGVCDLLDHEWMVMQLTLLERRTSRAGKDSIDHAPGAHDDIANAVTGALVTAYKETGVSNFNRRLPLDRGPM